MEARQAQPRPESIRRRGARALVNASLHVTRGRPLEGPGVGMRLLPWVSAGLIAFALIPFLPGAVGTASLIALSLVPVIIAAAILTPWERLPAWLQAVPALIPFAMVALVRSANESPVAAYTPVVLLPVFWFALYGTRAQLAVSVAAVGLTFALPSPAVDDSDTLTVLGAATLWMVTAGIVGLAISELVRQRERLESRLGLIANTDALTGLPNRRAWDQELERELARARRWSAPLCAALVDLDRFKLFNDQHGHQAGDAHLMEVAVAWRERLRATDLIARYGGEEFALLLPATTLAEALEVIDALRESVPRDQTTSGGVAEWDGSETGAELLARADRALYEAKRRGRDRTVALETSTGRAETA